MMKVMKFGGTSVGRTDRMQSVASLAQAQEGRKVVVLSALSGTTNALVALGQQIQAGEAQKALADVETLWAHYTQFIEALYAKPETKAQMTAAMAKHFDWMRGCTNQAYTDTMNRELLAQGELMSTQLFTAYCHEQGLEALLLPALDFMAINEDKEPVVRDIARKLGDTLEEHPNTQLFVTQGYICRNAQGEIDNLQRGGSDYTASLIGAAIEAEEVQIWTDIDGMHNNDPRVVDRTVPISVLSFDEAAELAYFGAKILHPASILPAQKYNVPVRLLNTMDPAARGTIISSTEIRNGVKAIAAKDGITAVKIKSSRMLLAYGFLRKVFEVFEKYRTPVDMITTSEVAVSLTIDDSSRMEEIIMELSRFGMVEVDQNMTIVCIVGNMLVEDRGAVTQIFSSLGDIPTRMISYGGSRHNISLLIDAAYKKEVLTRLNEGLFAEAFAAAQA